MNKPEKEPMNRITLEKLEAMLAEDMEEMSLYGCFWNFACKTNNG
ncbi:MAG: hypothetical protein AB2385_11030 [Symbiobacterium sp.]